MYKSPIADEEKIDFCRSLYTVCNVALRMKRYVVLKFLYLFITFFIAFCVILTFHFLATDTGLNLFGGGGVGEEEVEWD